MRPVVSIHGSVWAADSHGLFDYESSAIYAKSFRVSGVRDSYSVVLKDEQLQVVETCSEESGSRLLLRLEWRDGDYYLMPCDQQKLWIVVRAGRAVVLQPEDTLKLGRYRLRVRDIVLYHEEGSNKVVGIDDYDDETCSLKDADTSEKQHSEEYYDPVCRICLCGEDDDEANPLISPCKCSGSMKWVHLECLRTWMAGRLNLSSCALSFYWRSLECELCRVSYPRKISGKQGGIMDLLELPKLNTPYIILSPLIPPRGRGGVHVVSVGTAATVGRGHESEVRLADISVSRIHASIRFQAAVGEGVIIGSEGPVPLKQFPHGCLLLEDARSKFGTLLEVRQPLRLLLESSVSIQVGRVVLMFNVKRRRRFPLPFCLKAAASNVVSDITVLQEESPPLLLREAPL